MSDEHTQDGPELLTQLDQGVMTLTLNRPERLNALNTSLMRALNDALAGAARDPAVACVVLTGAGRAFCAGGDMKASAASRADPAPETSAPRSSFETRRDWLRRSMEAARLLHDMPKPTIAMINGACAGAGLSLAGACDLRYAGESAVLTTAFARAGLSGDYGGSWFWTRIAGTAKARELFFLSEKIDAQTALGAGLVTAVHPDAELTDRTHAIARGLARAPGAALSYMKRNLNAAETQSLEAVFDLEAVNMLLSRQSVSTSR